MSPPGRSQGDCRIAKHGGFRMSPHGRPKGHTAPLGKELA